MRRKKQISDGQNPENEIENALLKRALGFKQEEIYSEDILDRKTGESTGEVKRKIVTKEIPPDVRALLFWLKNRSPARWRDRIDAPDESPDFDFDEIDEKL